MSPTAHLFLTAFGSAFGVFVALVAVALLFQMLERKEWDRRAQIMEKLKNPKGPSMSVHVSPAAMKPLHDKIEKAVDDALELAGKNLRKRLPWHPDYPNGCRVCGTTDRPHKAKGMDKRCYERLQGREKRAATRAKASPRR